MKEPNSIQIGWYPKIATARGTDSARATWTTDTRRGCQRYNKKLVRAMYSENQVGENVTIYLKFLFMVFIIFFKITYKSGSIYLISHMNI